MSLTDDAFLSILDALLAHVQGDIRLSDAEVADLDVTVRTLAGRDHD